MESNYKLEMNKFDEAERNILDEVMKNSISILETFKFGTISHLRIKSVQKNKTLKGLKEFRSKHWNNKIPKDKAYEKYINLN
jgi:hypothetical protein